MTSSFPPRTGELPRQFRTPSPPLEYHEALSPQSNYSPEPPKYEQITPERLNGFDNAFDGFGRASGISNRYNHTLPRSSWTFHRPHKSYSAGRSSSQAILSHNHDDRAREEAELLLNFTREARYAVPKTSVSLSPTQHRSVSFSSFTQKRPSLLDLVTLEGRSRIEESRPVTQNGTKSIWKLSAKSLSSARAAKSRSPQHAQMPPPQLPHTSTLGSETVSLPAVEPVASEESAIRSESAESLPVDNNLMAKPSEQVDITLQEDQEHGLKAAQEKVPKNIALQTTSTTVPSATTQLRKKEDQPSICASCNFARNANENEADSDTTSWISCDGCRSWFHFACAGFKSEREVRTVDKFRCKTCRPLHGATTFVRKSTRAHTSVDYAGLNEGVVRTSDLDPEHHYVKDFKNGKYFTPETFMRIRPELVTAEFFERGDGMKEPVVIPAALNPRPKAIPTADIPEDTEDFDEQADKCEALHDNSLLDEGLGGEFVYETVQDEGQDGLDMVIPRDLTVRKVAELYGLDEKLEVINVKSQNGEDKPWTLRRWADYYESTGEKVVRNVISLEVSYSKLGRLIRRPKAVRDLDLQDSVWPEELQIKGEYPKVQFYCLMSVADCYTDFHIDFGGSSVYYHILRGQKTFFFIPPTDKHLKQYEDWCNSPAQNWTFLGDQTNQCYRVDLSEGDTMLIPAGWIHAVWTPSDSLVIGGNFLTRLHYPLQIRVAQIEKATNVARKFRYPYFQKLLWFTAIRYLDEDPIPETVIELLNGGKVFARPESAIEDYDAWGENSVDLEENYHARYYPRAELNGLPALCDYLLRTALIANGNITEGITADTRNAVKRSIPKGHNHGEPLDTVKKFALWSSWKCGNVTIPYWAYSNYIPESTSTEGGEKKLSTKARRALDSEAAKLAIKTAPDRQSTRPRSQPQNFATEMAAKEALAQAAKTNDSPVNTKRKLDETPQTAESKVKKPRTSSTSARPLSGRKTACEACRKSRRACKHGINADPDPLLNGSPKGDASIVSMSTPSKVATAQNGILDSITLTPITGPVKSETSGESMVIDSPYPQMNGLTPMDVPTKPPQKSGGRSKACKDCRKSKRRCIHDEMGNEDPKKMAESAIPRPAAKKKKAQHVEGVNLTPGQINTSQASPTYRAPPAPMANMGGGVQNGSIATPEPAQSPPSVPIDQGPMQFNQEFNPYAGQAYSTTIQDGEDGSTMQMQETNAYQQGADFGQGQVQSVDVSMDDFDFNSLIDPALFANPSEHIIQAAADSAEQALNALNASAVLQDKIDPSLLDPAMMDMDTPQQVNGSMVTPPDSRNEFQAVETSTEDTHDDTTPLATTIESSRPSSRPSKLLATDTPDSGTPRQPSLSSGGAGSTRDSVSPSISLPPNTTPLKRSKSRAQSEFEGDEASLKLIREMQAQDMGLRRRG